MCTHDESILPSGNAEVKQIKPCLLGLASYSVQIVKTCKNLKKCQCWFNSLLLAFSSTGMHALYWKVSTQLSFLDWISQFLHLRPIHRAVKSILSYLADWLKLGVSVRQLCLEFDGCVSLFTTISNKNVQFINNNLQISKNKLKLGWIARLVSL